MRSEKRLLQGRAAGLVIANTESQPGREISWNIISSHAAMRCRALNVVHHLSAQIEISCLEVDGREGGVAEVREEIIATTECDVNDGIFDSLCGGDKFTTFTKRNKIGQTPGKGREG
jgi:hypothetical protein